MAQAVAAVQVEEEIHRDQGLEKRSRRLEGNNTICLGKRRGLGDSKAANCAAILRCKASTPASVSSKPAKKSVCSAWPAASAAVSGDDPAR